MIHWFDYNSFSFSALCICCLLEPHIFSRLLKVVRLLQSPTSLLPSLALSALYACHNPTSLGAVDELPVSSRPANQWACFSLPLYSAIVTYTIPTLSTDTSRPVRHLQQLWRTMDPPHLVGSNYQHPAIMALTQWSSMRNVRRPIRL